MATNSHLFQEALGVLKQGEPIIFPTDTLYGLGISVVHAQSPEILYTLKKRSQKNPVHGLLAPRMI